MKNIVIILDPAHGSDVKGKSSPDGGHKEYIWSRLRVKSLKAKLERVGYVTLMTNNSDREIGLTERKKFASNTLRGERKLLISLHNNAAGDGSKWMMASGVEIYTSPGVTKSDVCADFFIEVLKRNFPDVRFRLNSNSYLGKDKEEKFTVLMGDDYMGVLIEWLFQDNKDDVRKLSDELVNDRFESSIVEAIEKINNYFTK